MAVKSMRLISLSTSVILVGVVAAALWLLTLSPGARVAEPFPADSPLPNGHAPWDSITSTASRRQTPPLHDARETAVLLQDWEYTSFPISHWRQ
jgi:hypothetical protein